MTYRSPGEDLALHGARVLGFPTSSRIAGRFGLPPAQVERGQHAWVDAPDRDSCHILWIQFHEDLPATLGIPRGPDA